MDTNVKLFLDLEDTVITTWEEGLLVHTREVRDWIKGLGVTEARIFSFAIWNAKDSNVFVDNGMKHMLEDALEVQLLEWLSVEEMMELSKAHTGLRWVDRMDFMQLRGKHGAFFDVCKGRERDCKCILLDDAVPHETLHVHHRNLELELKPVQQLVGKPWTNFAP